MQKAWMIAAAGAALLGGCQLLLPEGEDGTTSGQGGDRGATSSSSSGAKTSAQASTTGVGSTTASTTGQGTTTGPTSTSASSSTGGPCVAGQMCSDGSFPSFTECPIGEVVCSGGQHDAACSNYCGSLAQQCAQSNQQQFKSDVECCAFCNWLVAQDNPGNNGCCRANFLNAGMSLNALQCTVAGPIGSKADAPGAAAAECGTQELNLCKMFVDLCPGVQSAGLCDEMTCMGVLSPQAVASYKAGDESTPKAKATTKLLEVLTDPNGSANICPELALLLCPPIMMP